MNNLEEIYAWKKITDIVFRELPLVQQLLNSDAADSIAWTSSKFPDCLFINPKYIRWNKLESKYGMSLEDIVPVMITHESLHNVLFKLKQEDPVDMVTPNIGKSRFWTDGDLRWLQNANSK